MRTPALAGLVLFLAGCAGQTTGPSDLDSLTLVPEFANSSATEVDAAGIGGARLPEELALTAEQKAAIAALHEAFRAATAADVAALRAIEAQARAAHAAGKSREEIHEILAQGRPILERLHHAFALLQAAIWLVYTPEQRAWIEAHRPRPCGPAGPPPLTDEQKQQIGALQEAFMAAVRDDIQYIRQVVQEAHQAAQSGATREEIEQILHQADEARARLRAAERKLQEDIAAVLTPEQRAARCHPRPPGG